MQGVARSHTAGQYAEQHPVVAVEDSAVEVLPPGWKQARDQDGTVYYYNKTLGTSTYDPPVVPSPPLPPPPPRPPQCPPPPRPQSYVPPPLLHQERDRQSAAWVPQPQLDQAADYESAASMPLSQLTQVTLHQSPSLGLQQPAAAAGLPPGFVRRDYASMRAMLMHLSGGERARVAGEIAALEWEFPALRRF